MKVKSSAALRILVLTVSIFRQEQLIVNFSCLFLIKILCWLHELEYNTDYKIFISSALLSKLAVINVSICAVLRQQFLMRTCFHNIAVVHYQYPVRIVNG
jgi:hypothetical protein